MTPNQEVLFECEFDFASLAVVAQKVADVLSQEDRFCVWLRGDLGAGKTTLVRHVLYALGLQDGYPVPSPTFAYMYEYAIRETWYAHLDLYRGEELNLEDLGIVGYRRYGGYFVEWPEKMTDGDLPATHEIKLTHVSELSRSIIVTRL